MSKTNSAIAHGIAASLGFPYIRGEGMEREGVWLSRFTKTEDGRGDALYVGFKGNNKIVVALNAEGQEIVIAAYAKKAKKGRY